MSVDDAGKGVAEGSRDAREVDSGGAESGVGVY